MFKKGLIHLFIFASSLVYPQEDYIAIISGMKQLYHPVSTKNAMAQDYFNQGLTYIYVYNDDAAYRSFVQAAKHDPELAMAYWGIAFALNNWDYKTDNIRQQIIDADKKAQELAHLASENEQDYIFAFSKALFNATTDDFIAFQSSLQKAMQSLIKKYPDDLDIPVLNTYLIIGKLHKSMWNAKGEPLPIAQSVIDSLEIVLQRDPYHPGANHFYVHVMENSRYSNRALMCAMRSVNLLPASGHFLHMPSHIFINCGYYLLSAKCNEEAVKADLEYQRAYGDDRYYIMPDAFHCYDYCVESYLFAGRFEDAYKKSLELKELYLPIYSTHPELELYLVAPFHTLWRFHKWQEIINAQMYPENMKVANAYVHFSKALAYAALGDRDAAYKERDLYLKDLEEFFNSKHKVKVAPGFFDIATLLMEAKLAKATNQPQMARELLMKALHAQGGEPQDWHFPIYEMLGAEYLLDQKPVEAEYYFRLDLDRNYLNPRSLFGLMESLNAQGRTMEAIWVQREFKKAWKDSTTEISLQSLAL